MIVTTVDPTVVIKAERGEDAEKMRKILGNDFKSTHIVVTVKFDGAWPTKRDMREELEDCFGEILSAFEAQV